MKHFLVVTNPSKDKGLFLTDKIKHHIERRGGTCYCVESREDGGAESSYRLEEAGVEIDCAIVLGGDGTFIRAARDIGERIVPMIGVNLGTLGFLCEVEEEGVMTAIDRIMADDVLIEPRLKLFGEVIKGNQRIPAHTAMNDIVIHRYGLSQIVSLNLYINGKFLCKYNADGVIISTPTGSSAYNMSAGGPIVDPKANSILITPICPQGMSVKSIVIDADDEIAVEVLRRNKRDLEEGMEASFDGDQNTRMTVGDVIVIRKAPEVVPIMKLSEMSFIERLKKKMVN